MSAELFVRPPGAYLLSHSVGLPLRSTRQVVAAHLDVWETDPEGAWPAWLGTIEDFRSALAGLLGGHAAEVCPQANVSSGLTKVLGALPEVRSVLMSEDAFPSLGFVCTQLGLDVRFVPRDEGVRDLAVWRRHLADAPDVVLVTQVHSNTGELVPVAEVAALARAAGAMTIVDVAQSAGVIPLDVTTLGADVLVGSCVKWLSGGPGAGWLWVADGTLDRCRPTDVGWFSHAEPFAFDIHDFRPADDALQFWGGTPSVLPFVVAGNAIRTLAAVGIEVVRAHNLALGERLLDGAGGLVASPADPTERGGTVIVDPGDDTDAVVARLAAAHVAADRRERGLRLSPHLHTTADDVDLTLAVLHGRA